MKHKVNEENEEEVYGVSSREANGVRQKTGINHNYNQRARKLHQVRPLWPRYSRLPASHENLSFNFGFLQGRCFSLLCIRCFFHGFSRVSQSEKGENRRIVCVTLLRLSVPEARRDEQREQKGDYSSNSPTVSFRVNYETSELGNQEDKANENSEWNIIYSFGKMRKYTGLFEQYVEFLKIYLRSGVRLVKLREG